MAADLGDALGELTHGRFAELRETLGPVDRPVRIGRVPTDDELRKFARESVRARRLALGLPPPNVVHVAGQDEHGNYVFQDRGEAS